MVPRSDTHPTGPQWHWLALCCTVFTLALQSTESAAVYEMDVSGGDDYPDAYREWIPAVQMTAAAAAARPWEVSQERPWQREKSKPTSGYQHSEEFGPPPFNRALDVGDGGPVRGGQSAQEALEAIGLLENEDTLHDFKNWLESKIASKIPVSPDTREQTPASLESVDEAPATDRLVSSASAYGADFVVPRLTRRGYGNSQDDNRDVGKSSSKSYRPIPRRILEATKKSRRASELERMSKRSPNCMRRCMAQGLLHPAQCHSLC